MAEKSPVPVRWLPAAVRHLLFVDLPLAVTTEMSLLTVHGQWLVLDPEGHALAAVSDAITWRR